VVSHFSHRHYDFSENEDDSSIAGAVVLEQRPFFNTQKYDKFKKRS
jgi:histidinol phosphatase-like PHP family hydrolase